MSSTKDADFPKIIEVSQASQTAQLLAPLQAKPELCADVRAIWWDEKAAKPATLAKSLKFENVDEVAYVRTDRATQGKKVDFIPVGLHYSLRDVGAWCQPLPFRRTASMVENVQGTPTLLPKDHAKVTAARKAAEQDETSPEPARAVWAMHLVVPGLQLSDQHLYADLKTITHLTISLYPHHLITGERDMEKALRRILNKRKMPLLQHLHIQHLIFGAPVRQPTYAERDPHGTEDRTWKDIQRKKTGKEAGWEKLADEAGVHLDEFWLEDWNDWKGRTSELEDAIAEIEDERVTLKAIKVAEYRQDQLMQDVRSWTLKGWQERARHGRAGPWPAPMTESVREDTSDDEDEEDEEDEDDEEDEEDW